jgi:hypothetical protein
LDYYVPFLLSQLPGLPLAFIPLKQPELIP